MMANSQNPVSMIHRTHKMLRRCEDKILAQHRLTIEQYDVLMAIKSLAVPVRITDVALRVVRSVNSVSMIVDRMVKAGLLNRWRDEKDRRTVHVSITDDAETRLKTAMPAVQEFIRETLSEMSHDDRHDLVVLLGIIAEETTRERKAATI
jgi:DNA-binding MarR family transcriptional regulator